MENNTGLHILVVEDEDSVRDVVSQVLEDENHRVTAVESAEKAQTVLATPPANEQPIQLVISDIRLGGMDGIDLLEFIKRERPELEVVMMTSYASLDTSIKAIRKGAFDYLLKPFEDLDVITKMVDRVIEKIREEERKLQTVESLKALSEEVFNRLHTGIVLVDEACNILLSNKSTQEFFEKKSGLVRKENKLTATIPKVQKELENHVGKIFSQDLDSPKHVGVMKIARKEPYEPITLLISSIGNQFANVEVSSSRAKAIVFISEDKQKVHLSPDVLNILYGLSPTEARLTVGIVDGLDLDEIASNLNVSLHTARGYLKSVFKKTGTHKQGELIKLVLSGPAKYSSTEFV